MRKCDMNCHVCGKFVSGEVWICDPCFEIFKQLDCFINTDLPDHIPEEQYYKYYGMKIRKCKKEKGL